MKRAQIALAVLSALVCLAHAPAEEQILCPTDMVRVPGHDSCIDRYPWPNIKGVVPTTGLSGLPEPHDVEAGRLMDIKGLCESIDKRPCKREEWIASCKGPHESRYPWGNELPEYIPGERQLPCNCDNWYTPIESEDKVYARDPKEMSRLAKSLEPCGARPTCTSACGMVDAIGQVEEWVECGKTGRHGWCLMGGHSSAPRECGYTIGAHHPKWHYWATGGRCCLSNN